MKKIINRIFFSVIPALPVWIILGDLWVGVFVAFLVYITIHLFQFVIYSTTMATYEYFSQHFVDSETGKKIDAEKLRQIVDADPVYMEKLKKVVGKFL